MSLSKIAIVQNVPINDHRMVHSDGIARELVKRGYAVEVIIQKSSLSSQFNETPYKLTQIPGKTYSIKGQMHFMISLYSHLRRNKYDIIHAKNPVSSLIPNLLIQGPAKHKIIYDMRGLWIDFAVYSNKMSKHLKEFLVSLEVILMNHTTSVIAISKEMKKVLIERGVEREKIHVIVGAGVNSVLPSTYSEKYPLPEGRIIGYVGTISRSRSSDKIIQAFQKLKTESNEDLNLLMVGPFSNKEEQYFMRLVENLKISQNVVFTGFIPHDDALSLMSNFDVAVSYHEGSYDFFNVAVPTKILEYLRTGCCIVATNQKMYENILTDGVNALLTNQTVEDFSEGIRYVLENPAKSKLLRKNAHMISSNFLFSKIVDKLIQIYNG